MQSLTYKGLLLLEVVHLVAARVQGVGVQVMVPRHIAHVQAQPSLKEGVWGGGRALFLSINTSP